MIFDIKIIQRIIQIKFICLIDIQLIYCKISIHFFERFINFQSKKLINI